MLELLNLRTFERSRARTRALELSSTLGLSSQNPRALEAMSHRCLRPHRNPRSLTACPRATLVRGVTDAHQGSLENWAYIYTYIYTYIYIYAQPIPEHSVLTGVARHHTTNCRESAEGSLCQDHTYLEGQTVTSEERACTDQK